MKPNKQKIIRRIFLAAVFWGAFWAGLPEYGGAFFLLKTKPARAAIMNSNGGLSCDKNGWIFHKDKQYQIFSNFFISGCRAKFFCRAKGCGPENKFCDQADKITVKIINKGASAGTARRIQKWLAGREQLKVIIGSGSGSEVDQSAVFFKEEKYREEAQTIAQLLREKEEIHSYARPAGSDEEKSADIVIVLGKFKEAPPN